MNPTYGETADILRGNMGASEYKDYIFGMMFLKRRPDAFDEAREGVVQYYIGKGQYPLAASDFEEDCD